MTVSLLAIASIMVVGWAFGIVCDRLLIRSTKGFSEPSDDTERHACDTCKYEDTNPNKSPCKECAEDDMDLWEPFDM